MNPNLKNCLIIILAAIALSALFSCCAGTIYQAIITQESITTNITPRTTTSRSETLMPPRPAAPRVTTPSADDEAPEFFLTFCEQIEKFPNGQYQLSGKANEFPKDTQFFIILRNVQSGAQLQPGSTLFFIHPRISPDVYDVPAWQGLLVIQPGWTYAYYPVPGLAPGDYLVKVITEGDVCAEADIRIAD